MPRSSYVYLVYRMPNEDLLGAFTVKHEAISKMDCYYSHLELRRVRDGVFDDYDVIGKYEHDTGFVPSS